MLSVAWGWCGMDLTDVLQHTLTGREDAGSAWIWAKGYEVSSQQKDACSSIPSQHTSDAVPEDSDVVQTSWIEERPSAHFAYKELLALPGITHLWRNGNRT